MLKQDSDVKKSSNGANAYQTWAANELPKAEQGSTNTELYRAEPDLLPALESEISPRLQAAIEVLNDGGLQKLTSMQQRVFQLSIVEGRSSREVGKMLDISHVRVKQLVAAIGKILRPLCEKKLREEL